MKNTTRRKATAPARPPRSISDLEARRRCEHARRELRDHEQTCATCSPRKPCSIARTHIDAIERYKR